LLGWKCCKIEFKIIHSTVIKQIKKEDDIQALRDIDCTDEEIFEAVAVASLFNYMDRIADGLGVPVEGFQDMIEQMMQKYTVE
jgi:hypothetical protein